MSTKFPWKLFRANGQEIVFPRGARRWISSSVSQIQSGGIERTIDGGAVFMGDPAFRRHVITLTCSDQTQPPISDLWKGQIVVLESPREFSVAGPNATLDYVPVAGSVYGVDADDNIVGTRSSQSKSVSIAGAVAIRYRPIMECMVGDRTTDAEQARARGGWVLELEDLNGNEGGDDETDERISIAPFDLQSFPESGGNLSLNIAPNVSRNTGLPVQYSLAAPVPAGASISNAGVLNWNNVPRGGYAVRVGATSGMVSATQTVAVYRNFDFWVRFNPLPILVPMPNGSLSVFLAPSASTNTGQPLTFALVQPAPAGVSVSAAGLLSWTDVAEGGHAIIVSATAGGITTQQTFAVYRAPAQSGGTVLHPLASGGTITDWTDSDGINWRSHTFLSSDNGSFLRGGEVEVAVIGGGGGGPTSSTSTATGGATGAQIRLERFLVPTGDFSVLIGAGASPGGDENPSILALASMEQPAL